MTSPNKIDVLLETLDQNDPFNDLERKLTGLDYASLTSAEQEIWHHMYGIAAFRKNQHDEALKRFQDGLKAFPESHPIAFSLGQEYEYRRDIDKMLEAFGRAKFWTLQGPYLMAQVRYAYLWDKYDAALSYMEPLMRTYEELQILDDTFVYIRQLPFYGQAWATYALLCELGHKRELLEKHTKKILEVGVDFNRTYLERQWESLQKNDLKPALSCFEDLLKDRPDNSSNGWERLGIAIIESRMDTDLTRAETKLKNLQFSEKDFAWLKDMRTLALAELASRSGDAVMEQELQQMVLKNQPTLFEPDLVFRFHMYNYQERLKPLYQRRSFWKSKS